MMKNKTARIILYVVLTVCAAVLQTARGTRIEVMGVSPDMLVSIIVAVGFFDGPYIAGSLGLFAGVLCATSSSWPEGLPALFLALCGVLCGVTGKRYFRSYAVASILVALVLIFVRGLIDYVFYYQMVYSAPFGSMLLKTLVKTAISAPLSVLCVFAVSLINRRFPERRD